MASNKVFNPSNNPVAAEGKTIRQKIMDQISELARGMAEGEQPLWLNVFTGDTADRESQHAPFLAIEEGDEVVIEMYGGCTIKELPIIMTMRWRGGKGLDPAASYRYYLGKVQTTFLPMHEDEVAYPYVRDMREESNNPSYFDENDLAPSGSVVFVLQYSHARNNPYKLAGE